MPCNDTLMNFWYKEPISQPRRARWAKLLGQSAHGLICFDLHVTIPFLPLHAFSMTKIICNQEAGQLVGS